MKRHTKKSVFIKLKIFKQIHIEKRNTNNNNNNN